MIIIKNKLLRKALYLLLPCFFIPATVFLSALFPGEKQTAAAMILLCIFTLLFFICGAEQKKTGSRRLILASVMIALSVVGRFIPFFKPVTALSVISGIYLGGETGFLVGALSALISNFYFGQGPWTPFQMLAWGLIGLAASLISIHLKKSRLWLALYAVISGVAYSFVMDIWSVVWYSGTVDAELFFAAVLTALPHTLLYIISNVVFLLILAPPFGEKLERVKLKYGI